MPTLQIHHESLVAFYDEVHLIIYNLDLSRSIKSIINDTTRWEGLPAERKMAINQFVKVGSIPNRTLANALFLSIISGFENFLRNLLTGVIKEVEKKEKIPDAIFLKNIQLSGVALSQLYSPPSHLKLDYPHIVKNLATCYPSEIKTLLNEEIAGFVKTILDLENVFNFLRDCEIVIEWDHFVQKAEIKKMLKSENPRQTGKLLKEQLNKYLENRNRIAHTGLSSSDITIPDVLEAMDYFSLIGNFITTQCEAQLA